MARANLCAEAAVADATLETDEKGHDMKSDRSDPRTRVPKAEERIKAPYPHRNPQEQTEDALLRELDITLKDYGIEKPREETPR